MDNNYDNNNIISSDINDVESKKKSKYTYLSIISACIPIMLIVYCLIYSGGSLSEASDGAVWWLLIIYYWSVGIPQFILSLVWGISGLVKEKNKLAILGIIIDLIPLIIFLVFLLLIF